MRPAVLLALALALPACAASRAWEVRGAPDRAWEAGALGLARCAAAGVPPASRAGWGGVILAVPRPFPCDRWPGDEALCAGLQDGDRITVYAGPPPEAGALPHELAHAALCRPVKGGSCAEPAADALARLVVTCYRDGTIP